MAVVSLFLKMSKILMLRQCYVFLVHTNGLWPLLYWVTYVFPDRHI